MILIRSSHYCFIYFLNFSKNFIGMRWFRIRLSIYFFVNKARGAGSAKILFRHFDVKTT
jgi:hypothetical protein